MTQDSERPSFRGRASLGAMSWNLPNDNWSSPWSFEDEWTPPEPEWLKKLGQEPNEDPGDVAPKAKAKPAQADAADADADAMSRSPRSRASSDWSEEAFGLGQMILRFENERVEEAAPPLPVQTPPPARSQPPAAREFTPLPPRRDSAAPTSPAASKPSSAPLPTSRAASAAAPAAPTAKAMPAAPEPVRVQPRKIKQPLPTPEEVRQPLPSRVQPPVESPPTEATARRQKIPRRSRSFSWGGLISLSLGTFGFTLLAWVYLHDTPRESDEDLRLRLAVDQTPTTQAVSKLNAFLDSIRAPENALLLGQSPWTWDTPSLSAFVRSNGNAFDNLRDLLEDYDWHPHHAQWHREDLSRHRAWPVAGSLLQAQAAYLARRGDEEPALTAAMDLAELSRRLQEVWAWPGYMQRSLDLQAASVQLLAELLKSTHLDSATLEGFQTEFTQCQPNDELLRQACTAYYVHEKKLLLGPASGELLDTMPGGQLHQRPGRLFFKMNETLGLFADAFRLLRDEVARAPYTRLSVGVEPAIRLTSPRFYYPNSNGESYFSDHIEPYLSMPQDHSLAKARHAVVRCLFALRRYLADKKSLPQQLSELVPQYLDAVPLDPFSGEALLYDRGNGVVYSVGLNLIEEGGKPTDPPLNDDREPTVLIGVNAAGATR